MSSVGTHSWVTGQTVTTFTQNYTREHLASYDQNRWMNKSVCITVDCTSMKNNNCFQENKKIKNGIIFFISLHTDYSTCKGSFCDNAYDPEKEMGTGLFRYTPEINKRTEVSSTTDNYWNHSSLNQYAMPVFISNHHRMPDCNPKITYYSISSNTEDYFMMVFSGYRVEKYTNESCLMSYTHTVLRCVPNPMSGFNTSLKDCLRVSNPAEYWLMEKNLIRHFGNCSGSFCDNAYDPEKEMGTGLFRYTPEINKRTEVSSTTDNYWNHSSLNQYAMPVFISNHHRMPDCNPKITYYSISSNTEDYFMMVFSGYRVEKYTNESCLMSYTHTVLRCVPNPMSGFNTSLKDCLRVSNPAEYWLMEKNLIRHFGNCSGSFCDNAYDPEKEMGTGLFRYTPEINKRTEVSSTTDNSTLNKLINILEHDTRKCDDDASFCLENGNECVRSIPEKCSRMELHLTAESTCDRIVNVSKKKLQSSLDEFRRCVKRGSHMVLHRDKLSYDHHMLVSDVYEDSIRVIEYGFPEGTIDIIDTLSETSLGQIQYKTITFEELFQQYASKVYLVDSERYPKTTEQLNTAMERVTSRIGEKMYSISHSNCEDLVIWALEGKSTSSQWRDASVLRRVAGDVLEKILPVVVGNAVYFLLQEKDPNVPNGPPNEDSFDLSPPEDETIKRSINDTVAPNQKSSKLSTILRGFKYYIKKGNMMLATIYLLLKLVIVYMKWDLRPGRHNFMIIMIVVFRTFIFIFGPRFQLLEIDKLVFQNFFMSVEDIFREAFKILGICCLFMLRLSCNLTISETCVLCLCQLLCYILAGILFDAFIYPLFYFLPIL